MKINKNHAKHNHEITQNVLDDMSGAIKMSYSPLGANTLIIQDHGRGEKSSYMSFVSKDGMNNMSGVIYDHPLPQAIKSLVISTMSSVLDTAADGTTTTTILIAELYRNIRKMNFYKDNIPAQLLHDLIQEVVADIVGTINNMGIKVVPTVEDILNVVRTSVNNDKELVDVVGSAIKDMIEKGCDVKNISLRYEHDHVATKSSYIVDKGYTIPAGIVSANVFGARTLDNANVVIIDDSIATGDQINAITSLIEKVATHQMHRVDCQPLLIITYDIKYKQVLVEEYHKVMNSIKNTMQFMPQVYILEYMADGTMLSKNTHDDFMKYMGQIVPYNIASKVHELYGKELEEGELATSVVDHIFDMYTGGELPTAIVNIARTSTIIKDVKTRDENLLVEDLKVELETAIEETNDIAEKNSLKSRLSKLGGYYAVIKISSDNDWDAKRKADAVDDTVGAIRAAAHSGVCGGLSTLIPKAIMFDTERYSVESIENKMKDEIICAIYNSYKSLYDTIITNSGKDAGTYFTDVIAGDKTDMAEYSRRAVDVFSILSSFRTGKDTFDDVKSYGVLNSINAEIKILEATSKAVSTLLGINQVCFPDKYDCGKYESIEA